MYITLQSTKRNLGLFNLEVKDIVLAGAFALAFIIFFSLGFYQTGLVILFSGIFLLIPLNFSQKNRIYKLIILVGSFLFRKRTFYYHLETDEVRRDQYKKFTRIIQRTTKKK